MFHLYADVLLGLPLKQSYTYQVPVEFAGSLQCGMRVGLTFRNRAQTAIVTRLHHHSPDREGLRTLESLPDPEPIVNAEQIELAHWMADYYLCAVGEVLFKMFPKARRFPKREEVSDEEALIQHALLPEQNKIYQKVRRQSGKSLKVTKKAEADQPTERQQRHCTHLIHGVTGSGKTEIYIHLIRDALKSGHSALLLVPEISLTIQLIQQLKVVFGKQLALLHSGLKNSERFRAYVQLMRREKRIAVGTRSAVFAPLYNLGIIILDEEHDSSFKENSTPRYDARQVALKRAQDHQIPLLLGSATPRLETAYYARSASPNFLYYSLKQRAKGSSLPVVELVTLPSPETIISGTLLSELQINLSRKEQSILLLNRRGYFPQVYCLNSKTIEKCPACAVSLNLHRNKQLLCHYCGFHRLYDGSSSDGGPTSLLGTGTQKLEDFLLHRFPQARIERLDSDSVSKRGVLEDTLLRFLKKEIDILLGTQMIARGLDAPRVSLVGVLQAEKGLHLPDFRSAEKTFSLLTQVAGRAGRDQWKGRVIFECLNPHEPILQTAAAQDYEAFYQRELPARRAAFYPPFSRIVRLLCRGFDQARIRQFMTELSGSLEQRLGSQISIPQDLQILGPAPAPIEKMHNKFREHIIIKTRALKTVRECLKELTGHRGPPLHRNDYLEIDFDPADLL